MQDRNVEGVGVRAEKDLLLRRRDPEEEHVGAGLADLLGDPRRLGLGEVAVARTCDLDVREPLGDPVLDGREHAGLCAQEIHRAAMVVGVREQALEEIDAGDAFRQWTAEQPARPHHATDRRR